MELARVVGSVVATTKTTGLEGRSLLVVVPVEVPGAAPGPAYVAVDRVGAGVSEVVLVTRGSAARRAVGADNEVDAAAVAIVDRIDVPGMAGGAGTPA